MILIILAGLVSSAVAILVFLGEPDRDFAYLKATIIIVAGIAIGLIAAGAIGYWAPGACQDSATLPLVNLSTNTGPQSIYLGEGYVREELTYFYFIKDPSSGAIISQRTWAGNGRIFQDNPESPNVQTGTFQTDPKFAWAAIGDPKWSCTVDFHIPPDSVNSNYKVP